MPRSHGRHSTTLVNLNAMAMEKLSGSMEDSDPRLERRGENNAPTVRFLDVEEFLGISAL